MRISHNEYLYTFRMQYTYFTLRAWDGWCVDL